MPQEFVSDRDLVIRLQNDEVDAFRLLFDRYHSRLILFGARIVKSKELATDIVQDVFVKIWENRHELNSELSFQGYLYKITKNLLLNQLRRLAYERTLKAQWPHLVPAMTNSTDHAIQEREFDSLLDEAISKLPRERQRIFRMSREQSLTYEEIAESLGLSRHTVKAQMVKALEFLRNYVHAHVGNSLHVNALLLSLLLAVD